MANILLVDDDQDLLHLAQKLLASQHHTVMIAKDAMEAIDLLGRYPFHLIITDANMPQYSGFDFVKTVRNQDALKTTPIAMLTGRRERRDIDRAINIGVDDYIVKPIDPLLFLKKVEQLLSVTPLSSGAEIDVSGQPTYANATLEYSVKLKSVSELGVVVHSLHPLTEGKLTNMKGLVFEEMGITPPHLKILSHIPFKAPAVGFEVRLAFVGTDDATMQKIRSWIFKTQVKAKLAA